MQMTFRENINGIENPRIEASCMNNFILQFLLRPDLDIYFRKKNSTNRSTNLFQTNSAKRSMFYPNKFSM